MGAGKFLARDGRFCRVCGPTRVQRDNLLHRIQQNERVGEAFLLGMIRNGHIQKTCYVIRHTAC